VAKYGKTFGKRRYSTFTIFLFRYFPICTFTVRDGRREPSYSLAGNCPREGEAPRGFFGEGATRAPNERAAIVRQPLWIG